MPAAVRSRSMNAPTVRVSYLELTQTPAPVPSHFGEQRIAREKLQLCDYLDLYRAVGEPLRWDQRLKMPRADLIRHLGSQRSPIYVLRDNQDQALGFCEFERGSADTELNNFGLVPAAQGKGLGTWLLRTALHHEWQLQPGRIWLHTDNWDHPAALRAYERAGFQIYVVREEPPGDL
ncbi:MAG TPA: GNAT family N-acetyltransferase [Steroidobacteraceae bacterium]|nr:GNAT family N-acetyltransferase [Steroidobacteraceae bacterium]